MLVQVTKQAVAKSRELEEVVVLAGPADLAVGVLRAAAVDQVLLLLEGLAALAVVPFVGALEDVAGLLRALDHLDDGAGVPRLGCADEVVVADPQPVPGLREHGGHPVHPGLRAEAGVGGGLQDRLRMLVHSDDEVDVVSAKPPVAGDGVGADLLEGVPEMRVAVGVIDGRGDVELGQQSRTSQFFRAPLRASAVSRFNSSSVSVRSPPAGVFSVTRFPKMLTDSTVSVP